MKWVLMKTQFLIVVGRLSGKRPMQPLPGGKKERVSIVAGYCMSIKKTIAEFEYSGTMSKDLFVSWFKQVFITCLKPGKIIILDNASAHKSEEIFDLAREAGCKVIFLPPYSPDLNPIEKFWANLKRAIKSVMRNSGSLEAAITNAFCKTLSL